MKTYTLTVPATDDLASIRQWYDDQEAWEAGDRILESIADQCELLAKQPGIGGLRPQLGPMVRSSKVRPYLIFYRPSGSDIEILRVLHGRRNISRRLFD